MSKKPNLFDKIRIKLMEKIKDLCPQFFLLENQDLIEQDALRIIELAKKEHEENHTLARLEEGIITKSHIEPVERLTQGLEQKVIENKLETPKLKDIVQRYMNHQHKLNDVNNQASEQKMQNVLQMAMEQRHQVIEEDHIKFNDVKSIWENNSNKKLQTVTNVDDDMKELTEIYNDCSDEMRNSIYIEQQVVLELEKQIEEKLMLQMAEKEEDLTTSLDLVSTTWERNLGSFTMKHRPEFQRIVQRVMKEMSSKNVIEEKNPHSFKDLAGIWEQRGKDENKHKDKLTNKVQEFSKLSKKSHLVRSDSRKRLRERGKVKDLISTWSVKSTQDEISIAHRSR